MRMPRNSRRVPSTYPQTSTSQLLKKGNQGHGNRNQVLGCPLRGQQQEHHHFSDREARSRISDHEKLAEPHRHLTTIRDKRKLRAWRSSLRHLRDHQEIEAEVLRFAVNVPVLTVHSVLMRKQCHRHSGQSSAERDPNVLRRSTNAP